MKLLDTMSPNLPTVFGRARLKLDSRAYEPWREGPEIILPKRKTAKVVVLNPSQFLFFERNLYMGRTDPFVAFGGTDEQPFLTRLQTPLFFALCLGGLNGFYDALVPFDVKRYRLEFGSRWIRQGDAFFCRMPVLAVDEIEERAVPEFDYGNAPKGWRFTRDEPIVAGSHFLTGAICKAIDPFGQGATFVEGVVKAADHKPVLLKGPHMVSRTQGLFFQNQGE